MNFNHKVKTIEKLQNNKEEEVFEEEEARIKLLQN